MELYIAQKDYTDSLLDEEKKTINPPIVDGCLQPVTIIEHSLLSCYSHM